MKDVYLVEDNMYSVEWNNVIKSFFCCQTLVYTVLITLFHYYASQFYNIDHLTFFQSLFYSYCVAVSLPLIGLLENFLRNKFISIIGNSFIIYTLVSGHNFFYDCVALFFFMSTISKIRQFFSSKVVPVYIKWIPGCAEQLLEYNRKNAISKTGEYNGDEKYHDDVGLMGLEMKDGVKKTMGLGKTIVLAFLMVYVIRHLAITHINHIVVGGELKIGYQIMAMAINFALITLYDVFKVFFKKVYDVRGDQNSMSYMLILFLLVLFLFFTSYNYIFFGLIYIVLRLFFDTIAYYFKSFNKKIMTVVLLLSSNIKIYL